MKRGGLKVYNTMTRRLEPFETIEPDVVRMYVCGVTPYASAHVGHAMSAIVFDVIRRYLEYSGYTVRHAQNFTDIDDKIIARAQRENIDPKALTDQLIQTWHDETTALNIKPATVYPRATLEIPFIIGMIEGLVDKGFAYPVAGDVYYRVRAFAGYGKLSHRNLDDLLSGARIEVDERKEDPLDFALWKAAKPGEPSWESPWGSGRPGWHIECSAMCSHHLEGPVDLHGGGADLIFPHHENEIAQSEAYLGKEPFSRFWVHNGLLQFGGDKMSKSIGNIVQIRELLERDLGVAFRVMVLQSHYRAPLTYTDEALQAADKGLVRLRTAADTVPDLQGRSDGHATELLETAVKRAGVSFVDAMNDDFNTPKALAELFELARAINRGSAAEAAGEAVGAAISTLRKFCGVLGIDLRPKLVEEMGDAESYVDLLVHIRDELRVAKQWTLSDLIRDELFRKGITIADGPSSSTWRKT